jgi:hypothetical protein
VARPFEIIGNISDVEAFATGGKIGEPARLPRTLAQAEGHRENPTAGWLDSFR